MKHQNKLICPVCQEVGDVRILHKGMFGFKIKCFACWYVGYEKLKDLKLKRDD